MVYLASQGICTTGTNGFVGTPPPSPTNLVCLTAYGGYPQDIASDIELPNVQAYVRNTSYNTGQTKAYSIKSTLQNLAEQTINGKKYLAVFSKQSAPNYLGKDEGGNHIFTINFDIFKVE